MRFRWAACLGMAVAFLLSCGGPDEKKMKFLNRGKALYAKGDYVTAGLEFKNAIQIEPKFSDAHYQLGLSQLMLGDPGGAYRSIQRAVELDPKNYAAQAQLGKILLVGGEKDKAMEKAELVLGAEPANVEARLLKGAVYVAGRENDKAVSYLGAMIERGGAGPEVYLLLARAHVQEKQSRAAESVLLKGIAAHDNSISMRRALADVYAASGRVDDSAAQVRRVIELEPGNHLNRITLAGLYWDAGQGAKARGEIDALLSSRPADDAVRLDAARFYVSRRGFADAERTLLAGIGKEGKGLRLRVALGELYRNTGKTDQALAVLTEIVSLEKDPADPDVVRAKNDLARVHLARQEADKAESRVDEVIREDPRNLDARMIKGSIRLARRDGAGAVAQFRTVVSDNPQLVQGHLLLAQGYMLKKEKTLALETLQNALKLEPKSGEARKALGRYYASQGDFRAAESHLRGVVEADPRDIGVRVELGELLAAQKDFERAEAEYAAVKQMAPKHPLGYMKLGELCAMQKEWDRAAAEFRQAAGLDPRIYGLLGRFHLDRKEYRKATEAYEKAVEKLPGSWVAANDLAIVLCDHGASAADLERALVLAQNAQRIRPDEPFVHDTLGWVYHRKGDTTRALELLTRAQGKLPENPEVNYHLGMALLKAGRRGDAKAYLSKAVASQRSYFGKEEAARTLAGL